MNFAWRQLLFPANLLSLSRLLLAVPVTWLVAHPDAGLDSWLIGLILAGIATDVLDGPLSRALNQVSDLGKILDPLADKVAMIAGILAAVFYREFPALIVLLLGYRDVMILLLGALVTRRLRRITTANLWGKLNTFFVAFLCLGYAIAPAMPVTRALTYASLATIVISGASYYRFGEPYLFHGPVRWIARVCFFALPALLWWLTAMAAPALKWL